MRSISRLLSQGIIRAGLDSSESVGLKTVSRRQHEMGIPPVLSEKIAFASADDSARKRRAPVGAHRLGIFGLRPNAVGPSPNRRFERDTAIGVDRIPCPAQKRAGEAAIGRKAEGWPPRRDHISRIAAHKAQLPRLTLEL